MSVIGEVTPEKAPEMVKILDIYLKNGKNWPEIETVQIGNLILPVRYATLSFDAHDMGTLTLDVSMHRVRLHMPEDPDE